VLTRRALQIVATVVLSGLVIIGLHWLTGGRPSSSTEAVTFGLNDLRDSAGAFPEPGDDPPEWPRDHGAKQDQFAEYWLFAGVLADNDGRRYGFQLAVFRLALRADEPLRNSNWAARDVYRAHLVVTAAGEASYASERYSRAALGLSGAEHEPIRIWLENWQVKYDEKAMMFQLDAADAGYGLDLRLVLPAGQPVVVDGTGYRGYWWPGLAAEGQLTLSGRSISVSGKALLDRLWGRVLPVGSGQLALARLWLVLDDGRALRCRQLRRRAGGGTPLGECLLRRPDGSSELLERNRASLVPAEKGWRSLNGVRYPLAWHLQLADKRTELHVEPLAEEHEPFALPLWSGTVLVSGGSSGWGVLELTNYAAP
jgi:predicted secreted hydrolase